MNKIMAALMAVVCLMVTQAFAADATCESKAVEKKLAGAAKTSFIKKCDREAAAASAKNTCEVTATDKKLRGAAKDSFMKKCEKDAAPAK